MTVTSSESLVPSSSRPFQTEDGTAQLNVEYFDPPSENNNNKDWPVLLFVHGICESAETLSVQCIARACLENGWKLRVLELEGHGLSSGKRAVNGSFDRLVCHVEEFIRQVVVMSSSSSPFSSFALCGTSLGGVLAAYGAESIVTKDVYRKVLRNRFVGAALLSPAVGVDPRAVPSFPVVTALKILAAVAPSAGLFTPIEDPSHYACPKSSTRNYSGHWPMATCKMLLEVTSHRVKRDQAAGKLGLDIPALLVITGQDDEIVPLDAVQNFFNEAVTTTKQLETIPKADHGILLKESTAEITMRSLLNWLHSRVAT